MARKRNDLLMFDTFRLEGALFVPDLLEKIANGEHTSQKEADYQLPKGIRLDDELGRAFQIARAQWREFSRSLERKDAACVTRGYVREFLADALGYPIPEAGDGGEPSAFLVPCVEAGALLPVVVAPHTLDLDEPDARFAGEGLGHRRKSACQFAQEFLNAREGFLWALVTNGRNIRLVRDNASLTRPCYLDFDLETILSDPPRYADFKVLWRVLHASRAGQSGAGGAGCVWESWRADGQEQGTRVRAALRDGVTRALMFLGDGFLSHPDNDALRTALRDGSLTADAYFQQLLRTVYRFLFLFTVEERGILHPDGTAPEVGRVYEEGYSLKRLRARCLRKAGYDRYRDLWEAVRIVFRGLDKGEPRLGLPALGGLFGASQCRALDTSALDNRSLLSVMRDLRWTKADRALAPVDYRNIGPEELGSVYESLLELVPTLDLQARKFGFVGITDAGSTAGNTRKTTGSYYTPDCLVQELIKSALEPVLEERMAEAERMASGEWRIENGERRMVNGGRRMENGERKAVNGERRMANGPHSPLTNRHSPDIRELTEEEKRYAYQVLSRAGGVAEGNGVGRDGLLHDADASQRGTVRHDLADSAGGGIDSSQHRRGVGQEFDRGVPSVSAHRAGQHAGVGNASSVGGARGSLDQRGDSAGHGDRGPAGAAVACPSAQPGGEAQCVNGDWRAGGDANGERRAENGERRAENGNWGMENDSTLRLPLAIHHSPPYDEARFRKLWSATPFSTRYSLLAEHALLSLAVIDPACGSGHFLLAAARRIAEKLAQVRANAGVVKPQDYRHALRDVVASCIYGTDLNPMAVELAKIALWLEGFESGRPLSFLNHHLVCGNALLGITDLKQLNAGIPADAFKALSGDDKEACKRLAAMNRAALKGRDQAGQGELFAVNADEFRVRLAALDAMPGDRPEEIAAKEAAYAVLLEKAHESGVACAADLFVGAFLLPKQPDAAIPTSATLFDALEGTRNAGDFEDAREAAQRACESARVLHWPLAFAQIFARGGFDCVLGNPPWERIKLQEEEFFATRHPEIAEARNKAERGQRIVWLAEGRLAAQLHPDGDAGSACALEVELFRQFIQARREAEASSIFAHVKGEEGGRYPLTGIGDVNTYALFAETICQIVSTKGRAGFIVPSGIAADDSTKTYFSYLTQNRLLFSLYDFENKNGIFPSVHRMYKFCLMTLGRREMARFGFFMTDTRDMTDERRFFELTPDEFRLINPNTLTCPVFRSQRDAELTKTICRNSSVLFDETREDGNPWGVSFTRLFDMANDSDVFLSEYAPSLLPLYEAKMIHQFDHRWATYEANGGDNEDACRNVTAAEKGSPDITVRPRYWVRQREVLARLADVPAAVAKAYVGDDESILRKAVANWLALTFVGKYPLATPRDIVAKVAGKSFADALPKEWLDEKFRVGTCAPPSAEELALIRDSGDLFETFDTIMDRRSPRWLMGWRDITNATNERTVIASVIPRAAVGNSMPLMLFTSRNELKMFAVLLGNLDSICCDFVTRHKAGGVHLNYFIFKQLPVLSPSCFNEADLAFIVPRVLELTYTSRDLKPWAEDLGYTGEPFAFDVERRAVLRAELDAYYAKLYGLNEEELRYILDPADVAGADYPSETFRVLKDREMREYGEYRTRRLVLEAWGRLESGERRMANGGDAANGEQRVASSRDALQSPIAARYSPENGQRSTRAYVDRRLYCRKLVLSMLAQSEDKLPLDRLLSAWVALSDADSLVRILGGSADVKSWAALWPDRLTDSDSLQATLWDLLDRQAIRVTRFHVVERREEDGTAGTEDVQMDARFALAGADAYATHAPRPKPIRREDYFDPGFLKKAEDGVYATA